LFIGHIRGMCTCTSRIVSFFVNYSSVLQGCWHKMTLRSCVLGAGYAPAYLVHHAPQPMLCSLACTAAVVCRASWVGGLKRTANGDVDYTQVGVHVFGGWGAVMTCTKLPAAALILHVSWRQLRVPLHSQPCPMTLCCNQA
jgi:hypothetical protein